MEKDLPTIVAEVGFNYDEDEQEFSKAFASNKNRLVNLCGGIDENGEQIITLSLPLGRKGDDDIIMTFDGEELLQKITRAIVYGEDNRER